MILAFIIIAGVATLFVKFFDCNYTEAMIPGTAVTIASLGIAGLAGNIFYGVVALCCLAIIGAVIGVIFKKINFDNLNTAFIILFGIFCGSLLLYKGDYLQHVDELHQWGLAIKYMYSTGSLPFNGDFAGDVHQYLGPGLFEVFFQYIAGYSESFMYVSSAFLAFIGLSLPFHKIKSKEAHKFIIYIIFMYLAAYPLYRYGFKSLYVDMAPMCWTAGMAMYWTRRDRDARVKNILLLITSIIMIFSFKIYVGAMLAGFVVMVAFFDRILDYYIKLDYDKRIKIARRIILACGIGLLVVVTGFIVFVNMQIGPGRLVADNVADTVKNYFMSFLTTEINLRSKLKIPPFFVVLMIYAILALNILFEEDKEEKIKRKFSILTLTVYNVLYLIALLFAYLFIFNSAESSQVYASERYFAICFSMELFLVVSEVFLCSEWKLKKIDHRFRKGKAKKKKEKTSLIAEFKKGAGLEFVNESRYANSKRIIVIVLILFFATGINKNYISDVSSLCPSEISSYIIIQRTKVQVERIKQIITPSDKVFMIHQKANMVDINNNDQFPLNIALYELYPQVNNCLAYPWKLEEDGAYINLVKIDLFKIENLPEFLEMGNYTYFWLFSMDDYLKENLDKVLYIEGGMKKNSLYSIERDNEGHVVGLKYVETLMK